MSSALKNRLVGTIILVALTVIFLPDFLDGKKQSSDVLFESVPAIPDKKPIINPEPFPTQRVEASVQRPVEIVKDAPSDELLEQAQNQKKAAVVAPQEAQEPATTDDTPVQESVLETASSQQENSGWVIQLGSFKHQKNVRFLLDKLQSAEYRAFSRPIQTQSGTLTKVYVGPHLQKSELDNKLAHLKELTGLNGKVTRFTPVP